MRFFSRKKKTERTSVTSEADSITQEQLNEEKQDMIQGVEELSSTTVKEVMIPRIDTDFISSDVTQEELMDIIISSGHSRFPVYTDSIDNVVGVLYVKDLLKNLAQNNPVDLSKCTRKAYFVPETKHIDSLLREFKKNHLHIAIAIDEYGGTSGIVTMEDIIEEIVGDIQDEFDNDEVKISQDGENSWMCDARVDLDELNETLGADFPSEEFESLSGFVFGLFGKVPVKYEKISWNEYEFIIHDMEGHRINMVKISKNEDSEEVNEE